MVALDALTGEQRWKFEMTDVTRSGILTTAADLLFTGAATTADLNRAASADGLASP